MPVLRVFAAQNHRQFAIKLRSVCWERVRSDHNIGAIAEQEDIADDQPLFGEGLGLDSIDSIELIVLLSREYGITIQDPKEGRKVLVDVNTMADYVEQHRTK